MKIKIKNARDSVEIHDYMHEHGIHHHAPDLIYIDGMMIAPDWTTFGTNDRDAVDKLRKAFPDIEIKK